MQSEGDETVVAVAVAEGVKAIPDEVSHVLACNCKAIEPCKRGNCSCMSLKISCTEFCACKGYGRKEKIYYVKWSSYYFLKFYYEMLYHYIIILTTFKPYLSIICY